MEYPMTSPELPPLQEHPMYIEGLAQISTGQWQKAIESFRLLQSIYPDEGEVKELLDEAHMRATFTQFHPTQRSLDHKRTSIRPIVVSIVLAIIVIIAGYVTYELWINPVVIQELRLRQITSLRNQADEAIAGGDYALARQTLEQLQAILPEDPETIEMLHRVEQVEKLSQLYDRAKAFMAANSWDQAVEILTELQSLDAQYRDLPQMLQTARESQALDQQFRAAEEAFARGDWPAAIAQYEALQQANLTFRFDEIQARLFESHLKYGQNLLAEDGENIPNQVAEALAHFSEALQLRPIDPEALNQRRLAESYLVALNSTDQDEVIDLLQTIYKQQPDYAGQKVAQLLYTTLLKRAASLLTAGNKAAAMADYQVAAQLQVDDPSEAQQKLTELNVESASQ